ncbi:hypothetical protein FFLO_06375 [Filobasidium floriforme]|uniref:Uncharacterized protein n=1 Tax=Filobasidium floriforme TaxID=5210 RepID=A0A8K0JHD3_9TREE|nr:hypothetical protein FFLO_06375 [Filobasidium floriforme]
MQVVRDPSRACMISRGTGKE